MTMKFLPTILLISALKLAKTQDPCATQDAALDSCMETARATDAQKTVCDSCIESITSNVLVAGAVGTFCATSNAGACAALIECPCLSCADDAVAKGECEVTDERTTSGSNCNEDTWGGPLMCTNQPPSAAPGPTDAPANTCNTQETTLDTCLDAAGATDLQKSVCEACIETIARLAGAIDDNTDASCTEVDQEACLGLSGSCNCLTCNSESIAYGECSIDEERMEDGSTVCGPISCAPGTPTAAPGPTDAPMPSAPTDVPSPTDAPSSAFVALAGKISLAVIFLGTSAVVM